MPRDFLLNYIWMEPFYIHLEMAKKNPPQERYNFAFILLFITVILIILCSVYIVLDLSFLYVLKINSVSVAAVATFLTALFAMNVFDYGWSWGTALMFGSILSATDPVAVVALLKELGSFTIYHVKN